MLKRTFPTKNAISHSCLISFDIRDDVNNTIVLSSFSLVVTVSVPPLSMKVVPDCRKYGQRNVFESGQHMLIIGQGKNDTHEWCFPYNSFRIGMLHVHFAQTCPMVPILKQRTQFPNIVVQNNESMII